MWPFLIDDPRERPSATADAMTRPDIRERPDVKANVWRLGLTAGRDPLFSRGGVYMVMEVPVSRSHVAIVDDEDFELVSKYKWILLRNRRCLYAIRPFKASKTISMHRLIMGLDGPRVDHINGDGLDNRRSNLRHVSNAQNCMNKKHHLGSSSKYKGVHWHKQSQRWRAYIFVDGKHYTLGNYKTEVEAALVYDREAVAHFGEYARTNSDVYGDYANLVEGACKDV